MRQYYILIILLVALSACKKGTNSGISQGNVIVINEGGFNHGNASLSLYNSGNKTISNNVYSQENGGALLGDVAQSLYLINDTAYIVMNNSQKIIVADASQNFKYIAAINIPNSSPRFFLPVDGRRAYVTELYANKIWVIDYKADTLLKSILVNGWTEQLMLWNGKVYVQEQTAPSGAAVHAVLKIDPTTDNIVGSVPLSSDPGSMVLTDQNQLFVLSPQQMSPTVNATLYDIDMNSFSITHSFTFPAGHTPNYIRYSTFSHQLLYADNGIYTMPQTDTALPATAFIPSNNWNIYGLNADPSNGDIYVSDALDYQQASHIMRFSSSGVPVDAFYAGIITNGFVFK